jgi:three-Cys-motif partner protein
MICSAVRSKRWRADNVQSRHRGRARRNCANSSVQACDALLYHCVRKRIPSLMRYSSTADEEADLAKGITAGLLDSNDHTQSIFKHAIVRSYIPLFLAMTGSTSDKGRVVVMDGFAGRGRYADGSPGSAELIMRAVQKLQGYRSVATFFAETDPDNYRMLAEVVGEYSAKGLPARSLSGSADDHLSTVISAARGVPLFLFLDPCGALLPYSRLAEVIGSERRAVRPQTEILMNFSADFTRRTAGQLAAGRTGEAGIARMDTTCGGEWWRATAMGAYRSSARGNFEPAAEAVVNGYAERLARSGGMLRVTVPVRRRLHHQPVYHLVFLTRSQYGLWVFADALGKARQDWLRAIGRLDDDSDAQQSLPGMSRSDDMQQLIDSEKVRAQEVIEANLRDLARTGPFKLVDHARQVFGDAYGIATDTVVSAAVRALEASRQLITVRKSSRIRDRVVGPA